MIKPTAKMKKMRNSWLACISIVDFMSREASATPMAEAMVVFFVRAMSVLPNGTMAARTAWGKMIVLKVCEKLNPNERAASA